MQRAMRLLGTATPGSRVDDLATLSIGECNRRLITLRGLMFGDTVEAISRCSSCGAELEFSFELPDVCHNPRSDDMNKKPFVKQGYTVSFRAPTSSDLLAVAAIPGMDAAREELFRRCIISARYRKKAIPADTIPPHVAEALEEWIAQIDPLADIRVNLTCSSCQTSWDETFDIGSFFWHEIHAAALRIMREVHELAMAYGWNEREILGMSPVRRETYLEMIGR